MSDNLSRLNDDKFKNAISSDNLDSLEYVKNRDDVVLKIRLTCKCLKSWYDLKNTCLEISYVQILNGLLAEKWGVKVREDCLRIEGRLRRICSETSSRFRGKSGDSYMKLCDTIREFEVRCGELVKIEKVEKELENTKQENETLKEEKVSLENKCEELFLELQKAIAKEIEMQESLITALTDIEYLEKKNAQLYQYLEKLSLEREQYEIKGNKINEVKQRQKRRKLKELKTTVEKSLWFAKTLGLNLQSACFKDEMGQEHNLQYQVVETRKAYKDLSDEDKEKVKSVLFLTDKFCISNASYHELTMATGGDSLPRSYLIKQCKEDMNKLCHVLRTPGTADGAQLNILDELKNRISTHLVCKKKNCFILKFS